MEEFKVSLQEDGCVKFSNNFIEFTLNADTDYDDYYGSYVACINKDVEFESYHIEVKPDIVSIVPADGILVRVPKRLISQAFFEAFEISYRELLD